MSGESFDAGMEAARRTGERLRGCTCKIDTLGHFGEEVEGGEITVSDKCPVHGRGDALRRLDEAQDRLQRQSYTVTVTTSGPTPMPIPDALSIFLANIRSTLTRLEAEAADVEERLAESEDIRDVCPSRTFLDYISRLDFGHGDREDDRELYDALATLRMVVG